MSSTNPTIVSINPPGASIPGISSAMLVKEGRILFLSGQIPYNEKGELTGRDVATQLEQVFANLNATLRAAGGGLNNLARITIYVRDYKKEMLPQIRTVRDRWINADCPPASTLIGVAALVFDEILIEVDAVAVLPAA